MSGANYTPVAGQFDRIAAFVLAEKPDIPESSVRMAARLLVDTIGVCAGAANLEVGKIAREFATSFIAGGSPQAAAPILFDGRMASLPGAAYAAATQIDNLDGHDGYNPVKGHIGCAVVPALLAFSRHLPELGGREALEAMVIAYEVAARAGKALHGTVSDYHTSGAWNALGVAALGCRLLGHDESTLRHAIGIAEYHGPRSQMMREIDNPTMLHDGSGMGAMVGVSSVLLAAKGFTGAPAATLEMSEATPFWQDLGEHWTIEQNYVKPYPICRWAHGSIDAVRAIVLANRVTPDAVASIEIRTFHEGSRLFAGMPENTTQAQYSLPFAVATFLRHGRIGPEHVQGAALSDPGVAAMLKLITVSECDRHNSRFPSGRWADATIELKDGTRFESGDTNARGGPDSPFSDEELLEKFEAMTLRMLGADRAGRIWQAGLGLVKAAAPFAPFAELLYPPANPA